MHIFTAALYKPLTYIIHIQFPVVRTNTVNSHLALPQINYYLYLLIFCTIYIIYASMNEYNVQSFEVFSSLLFEKKNIMYALSEMFS